ncbi:hypothetical protein PR048_011880 [Dryococelus australis]|uniref:Uncharacterized protein n=1 Tax=Dryococelus australis TaxID=614101 RepID=A0ABQ9HN56_9NEOP|nr:hypothetical protein PR048_011880 [Dryococelus australis]
MIRVCVGVHLFYKHPVSYESLGSRSHHTKVIPMAFEVSADCGAPTTKTYRCKLLFFRGNHKWGSQRFSHCSYNWLHLGHCSDHIHVTNYNLPTSGPLLHTQLYTMHAMWAMCNSSGPLTFCFWPAWGSRKLDGQTEGLQKMLDEKCQLCVVDCDYDQFMCCLQVMGSRSMPWSLSPESCSPGSESKLLVTCSDAERLGTYGMLHGMGSARIVLMMHGEALGSTHGHGPGPSRRSATLKWARSGAGRFQAPCVPGLTRDSTALSLSPNTVVGLNVSSTAWSLETAQVAQGRENGGKNRPWPLLKTHPSIRLERFRKTLGNRNQDGRTRERTRVLPNASPVSHHCAFSLGEAHCGAVIRAIAFHQCGKGSIPDGVVPGFSLVGIEPDDAAGRRVFWGISHFPTLAFRRCSIATPLHPYQLLRPQFGAAVTEWLACSPPTKANRVPSLAGFSQMGIVLDAAAGQRVFSGISRFPSTCIPALLHFHFISPSSLLRSGVSLAAVSTVHYNAATSQRAHCAVRAAATTPVRLWRDLGGSRQGRLQTSGTIPSCGNPGVTQPGIEPGSPWLEAGSLTFQPPRPHAKLVIGDGCDRLDGCGLVSRRRRGRRDGTGCSEKKERGMDRMEEPSQNVAGAISDKSRRTGIKMSGLRLRIQCEGLSWLSRLNCVIVDVFANFSPRIATGIIIRVAVQMQYDILHLLIKLTSHASNYLHPTNHDLTHLTSKLLFFPPKIFPLQLDPHHCH